MAESSDQVEVHHDAADERYREGSFVNGSGHKIFTQAWVPAHPKALIILFHGLGEHSTRYTEFARVFADAGYAVHACDHQSHGMSEGPREYVDHFKDILEDAYKFATIVKKDYPSVPHIVIGHSMGGLIAYQLILQNPKMFDGAILSAPSNKKPAFVSDTMFAVGKAASFLFPWLRPQPLDISTLCRDPEIVKAYESDPLVWHSNIPLQLGSSILVSGNEVHQNAERLEIPYLMMQGSGDKMVVPEGNQEIHIRSKSKDKSFIMFRDFFHELFNEPEKKHLWQLALNWLNERVLADGTFQPKPTNYIALGEQDGSGGVTITAAPTL